MIHIKEDLGYGFHYERTGEVCVISSDDGHKMLLGFDAAFWFRNGFDTGINAVNNKNNKIEKED